MEGLRRNGKATLIRAQSFPPREPLNAGIILYPKTNREIGYIIILNIERTHTFHIPVLGLAFSIDTPLKVARFGISSVVSIMDDMLIEHMRKHHSLKNNEPYSPISVREHDYRARRITAYLNMIHGLVEKQIATLKASAFEKGSEIVKYFEMLPDQSPVKALYNRMTVTGDNSKRSSRQEELRSKIVAGEINVNIMTKIDKTNSGRDNKTLPTEFSDAIASMRGFVRSDLRSSVVLSAGLNPRLFSYMGQCAEFFPDSNGSLRKKVILKVSDFRSAYIQGKILAKKGIWISEFRIESGLNCGGHAFATYGFLLGPILEEFKSKRQMLSNELNQLYEAALREKGLPIPDVSMEIHVTVQGGIGTAKEDAFLRDYYGVDGTGWGSPFLLVPEATNLDDETRDLLAKSERDDFYLSHASPLGVPFNNLRNTTSEKQVRRRAENGKPGSLCTKKFLVSNTEFTEQPICTASTQYQTLKITELKNLSLTPAELEEKIEKVIEKACLCEDLAAPCFIQGKSEQRRKNHPVAICPGPNLAYFSKIVSLEDMVGYIYGRVQSLTNGQRPHMFIEELRLYIDYLRNEVRNHVDSLTEKERKYLNTFRNNLHEGIMYYKSMISKFVEDTGLYGEIVHGQLRQFEEELLSIIIPDIEIAVPVEILNRS